MSCKLKKDLTHCISQCKITVGTCGRYYLAYLWDNRDAMHKNASEDNFEEIGDGICCHSQYVIKVGENGVQRRFPRRIGEIHFLRKKWDMEVVSHECFHATNHICRIVGVKPQEDIEQEEFAAYVQGELTNQAYRWLWDTEKTL